MVVASLGNVLLEGLRLLFVGQWSLHEPCMVARRSRCLQAHSSVVYLSGVMDVMCFAVTVALSVEHSSWDDSLLIFMVMRVAYLLMAFVVSVCAIE